MTDWPVKTLGDLLEVSIGGIWGSEAGEDEVDVFVYRSTELIKDGQLKDELTVRRSITARQLDSRKLEEGDLLLEKSGGGPKTPVGRVGLVKVLPGLSVCSNFMQLMRPRKKEVLPVYLHYFLNHFHVAGYTEDLQNNSTNIRNLKTTEYMEVEIPVPPLEEQKRIVELLNTSTAHVTELTACYEQARTHANNLFISASREVFEGNPDWPVKTLGDLMTVQNGYAFDSQFFSSDGKIGLIRIRDLKSGTDTETRYTGQYGDDYVVSSGDYLIGMDGEFRCYEWQGEPALLNQRVCRLRGFDKTLESRFLFYGINKYLKDIEDVTGYTTVKHLSSKSIPAIEMPVPPLEEQKRIVARLDSMRAKTSEMVAAYDAKLVAAKNLRQSILESAFGGDL